MDENWNQQIYIYKGEESKSVVIVTGIPDLKADGGILYNHLLYQEGSPTMMKKKNEEWK